MLPSNENKDIWPNRYDAPIKNNNDKNIWQTRHDAQIKIIDDELKTFDPTVEWQARIRATLIALQAWSNDQFQFFASGFDKKWLVGSRQHPAEYALRRTVDQTAYDIEVLRRAYMQRLPDKGTGSDTLARADRLAYMALQPAINTGLLGETTVITYFQKEPNVRVIPYAPLALIGIPYTCVDPENNAQDFLAIPHEVAHYVYAHGQKRDPVSGCLVNLRALLHENITPYPSWYRIWIEEIFADIYSTLVAGPVSALSMQEMLFDNLDLMDDHGHYPVPVIRPQTHIKVLREMRRRASPDDLKKLFPKSLINELKDYWEINLLGKRGRDNDRGKRFIIRAQAPGSQYANRLTVTDYLTTTANDIFKVLDDVLPKMIEYSWAKEANWSTDNSREDLYARFRKNILLNDDFLIETLPPIVEGDQFIRTDNDPPNQHRQWFDHLKSARDNGIILDPTVWKPLLGAGWVTNGPESDHPG